jgi:hypothetical protein
MRPLYLFITISTILISAQLTKGQSRNSIGFAVNVNTPLRNGYTTGYGWAFQGNIRLNEKWAIVPVVGVEQVKSDKNGRYNGYYFEGTGRSVGWGYLGASAKYYFGGQWFGYAGGALYVGGDDAGSTGPGATAGAGYDLAVGRRSSFELSLHADLLPVYSKAVPVGGVKLAYKFNFSKRQ